MARSRLLLLVLIAAAIVAFFGFDLGRFFSLAYLKSEQAAFAAYAGALRELLGSA